MSNEWFFDTCASYHITGNRDIFVTYEPIQHSDYLFNDMQGGMAKPIGKGTVIIQAGEAILKLNDVNHVPTAKSNLISAATLEQQGLRVTKSNTVPSYYTIYTEEGETITASLMPETNVYTIETGEQKTPIDAETIYAYSATKVPDISSTGMALHQNMKEPVYNTLKPVKSETLTLTEWHQRLGHLNQWDILKLAKDVNTGIRIKGSKTLQFCEICSQAKQTRTISKTPMPRANKPLMRIHIDIVGGGNTLGMKNDDEGPRARQGAHYALVLTDDATRFRWIYFIAKKSDALGIIKWWLNWLKNRGFPTPAYFHLDNELVTNEARQMCLEEGIKLEPSNPHSPWQDGVSERAIRIILERARAILLDSKLPKKFWGDAFEFAVNLTNNMPTSTPLFNGERSPFSVPLSAWFKCPPELQHFRKFGSPVWYHLHGSAKPEDKLSASSKKGYLIGYNGNKIYRIWDPTKDTILTTSDVDIVEDFGISANNVDQSFKGEDSPTKQKPIRPFATVNPTSEPLAAVATAAASEINLKEFDPNIQWIRPAKDYKVCLAKIDTSGLNANLPTTLKQAINGPEGKQWREAAEKEIQLLQAKRCWNLIRKSDIPPENKVLLGKWVFRRKINDDGTIKHKARWVVRGDMIKRKGYGAEEHETYSPVVDSTTTNILFALAAHHGWHVLQADAVLAFLNGKLTKPVYMVQPTGFEEGDRGTLVCEVLQSLYGLDSSPRIWYDTLGEKMKKLGFRTSPYDAGLWISTTKDKLYVTAHVDDFKIVCQRHEDGEWLLEELGKEFELKDLGKITRYLGMDVTMTDKEIKLSQQSFTNELLERFGLQKCNPVSIPIAEGTVIDDQPDPSINITEYQSGVGSLQYLADKTRPDIARAATLLAEHNIRPTKKSLAALHHVLRYLKGTMSKGIVYKRCEKTEDLQLPTCFSDSNWGDVHTDKRRSVSGYVFMLAGGPVSWKSRKQTCIATSSNEAEYIAASEAAKQAVWIKRLMIDMGLFDEESCKPLVINMDNQGAHDLIKSTAVTRKSKHIDIRFHYTKDLVQNGMLAVQGIASRDNAADGFTKPLNSEFFKRFLELICFSNQM
jgi:hypothetical protein